MTLKEYVSQAVEELTDTELEQVAEYLAFLKFRALRTEISLVDKEQIASLYAEFASEDSMMAEEGMSDYQQGLLVAG